MATGKSIRVALRAGQLVMLVPSADNSATREIELPLGAEAEVLRAVLARSDEVGERSGPTRFYEMHLRGRCGAECKWCAEERASGVQPKRIEAAKRPKPGPIVAAALSEKLLEELGI